MIESKKQSSIDFSDISIWYSEKLKELRNEAMILEKKRLSAIRASLKEKNRQEQEKRIKIKNEIIDGVHIHRCFHIAKVANFESIWPSVFPKLMKGKFDIIHSHVFGHVYFVLSALAAKLNSVSVS